MATDFSTSNGNPDDVRLCLRNSRQLHTGLLTFEEYAEKMTMYLAVAKDEYLTRCLDTISTDQLGPYAEYLREKLVPTYFMPTPVHFLVDRNSEAEAETIRQRLRPRYIAIYEAVLGRLLQA